MRNFSRYSTVLAAALSLGFVACGDDSEPGETDTNTTDTSTTDTSTTDTNTENDTSTPDTNTGDDTDTVVTDPCDPNPCNAPPAASCDGNTPVTYPATGTCTNEDGEAACEYTGTPGTACGAEQVCSAGACIAAGDACDYEFDAKVSYVTSISVGNQSAEKDPTTQLPIDACCFDFTDDGKPDNKLGSILKAAAAFTGDINGLIQDNIDAGELVLLLEAKGVDSVTADDNLDIFGFYGADADADAANNAAGTSAFIVNPSSFLAGTAMPIIAFEDASITAGVLSAGPSLFQLSIPIVGAELDIAVSNTRVEAVVSTGPNGNGLVMTGEGGEESYGAKLGGVIKKIDLINALNAYVSTCTCITFKEGTEGVLIKANGQCAATSDYTNECTDDDAACKQIPGFCSLLLGLVSPDVDLDEDGKLTSLEDGISVGVFVKATSATVSGVDQCTE